MSSKKILPWWTLAVGGLVTLTGLGCVVMYILEAIVARIGEPDQSLIFWYIPFLFIGIAGFIVGAGIGMLGYVGLRKFHQQDTTSDN